MTAPIGRAGIAARVVIAGLGLMAAATVAWGHAASDAYVTLAVDGPGIDQRMDVALRDLDRELGLDADGDGLLTWGEVRGRWDDIVQLTGAGLALQADGQDCRPGPAAAPALDEHVDTRHAVVQRRWQCDGAPQVITLDYRLFAATDPTHRGIVRVAAGPGAAAPALHVLVPGAAPTAVTVGAGSSGPGGAVGFFAKGLHHIAIGLDHVLFLVTLLLVAVWRRDAAGTGWVPREAARGAWAEALRLVTAFTVAHSLTLGLAAAGVLAPPSRWVESLIAVSVFIAAVDNLRPFLPGPRWVTVAGFGLVHGFGFAGPLQDLGLQGSALAIPLLAFNLGVEAGQVLILLVLLPAALAARRAVAYRRWVVRPVSAGVALLAMAWTVERALALPLPSV